MLRLRQTQSDHLGEAAALNNVGALYDVMGERDSALFYYRASIPLARAVGNGAVEASTLTNVGRAFFGVGQLDSALAYLHASLPLARAVADSAIEATTLSNIGAVYLEIGRSDSALYYLRASLSLARAIGDSTAESTTLGTIGGVFKEAGQPDSALSYYRVSLRIDRAVGDREGEATRLSDIGQVFDRAGRPDSALYYYRRSLPLTRAEGDRAGEATTLGNIGLVFDHVGQPDSALFYYRASLHLSRTIGNRTGEAAVLANIAYLYATAPATATNLARALAYYDSAAARSASVRAQSGGDLNAVVFAEKERGTFQGWAKAWIDRAGRDTGAARDVAINSALGAAERGRAQGLRDLLSRKVPNISAQSGSVLKPSSGTTRARLASAHGLAATDTVAGADLALEAHRELAPLKQSRTALLYFLYSHDSLTTWILKPSGELQLLNQRALPADSLAALVTTLRRGVGADKARGGMARSGKGGDAEQESTTALSRGVEDDEQNPVRADAAARALSAQLLPGDLLRDIPAGAELVIVPQGVLGLVPFAALTALDDTMPLGIRYSLRYAPSLRALREVGREAHPGNLQLVVGDPAMPAVIDAAGMKVRLRDLPAARAEGANIARRFGAKVLTGEAGSETVVREQLPKAIVVHLATHGLAFGSEARVRDSYVALAPDSRNDGLLTIGELLDEVPPLFADLVVLSACQTGLGDVKQAEGTIGFQRAFLAKGARTVLVSLWSVDDKATSLLMDRFYAHWLGPDQRSVQSKAEALRHAQSDVRSTKGYESPRYWAAFQLVGAR